MSENDANSAELLERLVRDTFRLRRIIAQNTYDKQLRRKFTFRYWVDTTIFDLFAEPGRNFKMVSAFPSLAGSVSEDDDYNESDYPRDYEDEETDDEATVGKSSSQRERNAHFANALLTGEFIFKKAGRGTENPILVSPEHASEIYSYIDNLERRSKAVYQKSEAELRQVYSALQDRLTLEASTVGPRNARGKEWLKRVRHSIVSLLSDASSSPLLAPYRLRTLFAHGAIANAAVALDLPEEVISPPYDVLSNWRSRIREAKRTHKVLPSPDALDADAVTLAQLEFANKNWRKTKQVCVLITSDRGLHRAYSEWRNDERRRSRADHVFYPLRDPLQYTPILNVADMEGQYRDDSIFFKVENSIKEFVASFSSTELARYRNYEDDPSVLPDVSAIKRAIRDRISEHAYQITPFTDQLWQEIDQIGSAWIEAIEYSVAAKMDVITELAHHETQLWRRASSRELLSAGFTTQVEGVRLSFEKLATGSTLLRQEIWALEHGPPELDEVRGHSRRAVASEYTRYQSAAFRNKTLEMVLADLRREKAAAIPTLRKAERRERLFVTGCLSLQIGAWSGAKSLLDRAIMLEEAQDDFSFEVRLFHCMARRLAADLREFSKEYKNVRTELARLRATEAAGGRGRADPRLRNEQLALELCELAYFVSQNKDITRQLRDGASLWRRLTERFGDRLTKPTELPYWQAVTRQFLLNSYNLLFWIAITDSEEPDRLRECVEKSLAQLERPEFAYVKGGFHGTLYPMLARYVIVPSEKERNVLAAKIGDCIEEALSIDEDSGFVFDVPFVDKAEFVGIMARLQPSRALKDVRFL